MAYTKIVCPSCGANIEFTGDSDFFFCQFCGTKIVKEKQHIELSGSVSVSGIAGEESLIERAFLYLEDGAFTEANNYLEKVLDINPRCSKAYIGKLMCQTGIRTTAQLVNSPLPLTNYDFFNKAMRFANPEEANKYNEYSEAVTRTLDTQRQLRVGELSNLKESLKANSDYLENNKREYQKCVAKRVLWKTLMVASIVVTSFFLLGTLMEPVIAVFFVPSAVWMAFMIKMNIVSKKTTQEYDRIKVAIPQTQAKILSKESEFTKWQQEKQRLIPASKSILPPQAPKASTAAKNLIISRDNVKQNGVGKITLIIDGKQVNQFNDNGVSSYTLPLGNHTVQFSRGAVKSNTCHLFIGSTSSCVKLNYRPELFRIQAAVHY